MESKDIFASSAIMSPLLVTTSGFISAMEQSEETKALYRALMNLTALPTWFLSSPSAKPSLRA